VVKSRVVEELKRSPTRGLRSAEWSEEQGWCSQRKGLCAQKNTTKSEIVRTTTMTPQWQDTRADGKPGNGHTETIGGQGLTKLCLITWRM